MIPAQSIKPGACNSAIYANAIFPVGRPVVVCIPQPGNLAAKPAVSLRHYRSATATPSQDGSDDCRRTLQPLQASGGFFDRGRGTRPVDLNLFGPFQAARRFFCTLRQLRQEARGVLSVLFSPSLSCAALVHGNHHEPEPHGNAQNSHGEIRNVEC
jgi:hypothetical protein